MSNDPIEELLRATASETRIALDEQGDGTVPPFEPNSSKGGVVLASVIAVLVLGIGAFLALTGSDSSTDLETANDPDVEAPDGEDVDPAPEVVPEPEVTTPEVTTPETVPPETIPPVVDLDVRPQEDLAQPAAGESYVDPAFGTTITRATNAASGEQIIPVQSPAALWNADETLMLLYRTGLGVSGHEIVDATTFDIVGELPVVPTDIEHVFWHPTNPDLIIATVDLDLVSVSVTTNDVTTIASYPECDSIDPGVGTSGPSWDGELMALRCESNGVTVVVSQPLDGGPASTLEVADGEQGMASADGEFIIIETATGFDIYDRELTELQSTTAWQPSAPHASLDADGNPIIVSAGFESDFPGVIVTAPLDGSGDVDVIVGPDSGFPFPRSGTLTAANSWSAPGVYAAASPLPFEVLEGGDFETFDGEVILVDERTTPTTVRRVAHTRNTGAGVFSASYVSVSPSGRFVAFASDWGGDSSNTYLIDLETP